MQDKNKNFYLTYCSSIIFLEYLNDEKTISVWKGYTMKPELNIKFNLNLAKLTLKPWDDVIGNFVCINCNKRTSKDKLYQVTYKHLMMYHRYLRTKPEYERLTGDVNGILNIVKPVIIMEPQIEENSSNVNKTDLKICVRLFHKYK